ncbi:MAG: valine--tRNA ligase, partial [Chloroflexota bacterium]|nr:valine--tRNA ligase [Chloroflexota bacterium]
HLPAAAESIMISPYPVAEETSDPQAEEVMAAIIEVIHSIRNARAEHKVESGRWIAAEIYGGRLTPAISAYAETIQSLARVKPVTFVDRRRDSPPAENSLVLVLKEADVVIPMASMIDVEAEKKRLQQEIEQSQAEVARLEAMLRDQAFLTKAPPAVVEKERQKLNTLKNKLARLKQQMTK